MLKASSEPSENFNRKLIKDNGFHLKVYTLVLDKYIFCRIYSKKKTDLYDSKKFLELFNLKYCFESDLRYI